MKKTILALLCLTIALLLCSCCLSHEWADATCETPKTCTKCGEIEGEALGHTWQDADCMTPKTCSLCSKTEGEALGHTWQDATCEAPKTCSACGETEGNSLEHTWTEATCNAPQTCSLCGATEGEALAHSYSSWIPQDTVMSHTCTLCGNEETQDIDLDIITTALLYDTKWEFASAYAEESVFYAPAGFEGYLLFDEAHGITVHMDEPLDVFSGAGYWSCIDYYYDESMGAYLYIIEYTESNTQDQLLISLNVVEIPVINSAFSTIMLFISADEYLAFYSADSTW